MKKLIMMSAAAGTGKSTYIRQYMEKHGVCDVISSDETRKKLTGAYDDFSIPGIQKLVYEDFWKQSEELVKKEDCTVFIDCACLLNRVRQKIVNHCPGYDCYELVMIHKPLDVVLKQNTMRDACRVVPEEVVKSMWESFELPDEETSALFSSIIYIDESGEKKWK